MHDGLKKIKLTPSNLLYIIKVKKPDLKQNISLTKEDWKKINGERLKDQRLKAIKKEVEKIISKADTIIANIANFSLHEFAKLYYSTSNTVNKKNDVVAMYKQIIKECDEDERPGSAISYKNSLNALLKFDPNISFASITPRFLREFEKCFLMEGKSMTSVGIYLRQLRAVYNRATTEKIISNEEYPFKEYVIPGGYNKKKALSNSEISKILNFETVEFS